MNEKNLVNEDHLEMPLVMDRGVKIYMGIDIQKNHWNVSIYNDHGHYSTFEIAPIPQFLKRYIDATFGNVPVVCAYCAAPNSSWIHRLLTSFNYQCLVIDCEAVPVFNSPGDGKHVPDSRALANALRKGLLASIFPESKQHLN